MSRGEWYEWVAGFTSGYVSGVFGLWWGVAAMVAAAFGRELLSALGKSS